MTDMPADHWDRVYKTKAEDSVSWFEQSPDLSLELIEASGARPGAVIDIGGGASHLVDELLAKSYARVAVLDVSAQALGVSRARLGPLASKVEWIVADVTQWKPSNRYAIWHDRAAFHFLNTSQDQTAYAMALDSALSPCGIAIIGTFALDGPETCSGLPVTRHDPASIEHILGSDFKLIDERRYDHVTPGGNVQKFQFSSFRKSGRDAR